MTHGAERSLRSADGDSHERRSLGAGVTLHSAAATSDIAQADALRVLPSDGRTTAMTMTAEDYDFVIGGDPDRDTIDLAVLDTSTGRVHAHLADAADGAGYRRMLAWAGEHAPGRRIWALEGTGTFAAGLVVFLAEASCRPSRNSVTAAPRNSVTVDRSPQELLQHGDPAIRRRQYLGQLGDASLRADDGSGQLRQGGAVAARRSRAPEYARYPWTPVEWGCPVVRDINCKPRRSRL